MLRHKSCLRSSTWALACLFFLLVSTCICQLGGQTSTSTTTVYGTVTERDSGQEARVPETLVSFKSSDGVTTTVRADRNGQFRASLPSGFAYSVLVSREGFCLTSRPPFEARAKKDVLFNFILTTNCPKDLVVSHAENAESAEIAFCANARRYYCQEQIAVKATRMIPVIVRFVTREAHDHVIAYGSSLALSVSNPGPSAPSGKFSVIVEFDTDTISANTVTLNLEQGTVIAKGNPTIVHDSQRLQIHSDCVSISLSNLAPAVRPCE